MVTARPSPEPYDPQVERQRALVRELMAARTAVKTARQQGDRGRERRARSRLLALYTAFQRLGRDERPSA